MAERGRPTEYTLELLDRVRDYILNYLDYGDTVPSVAGLAKHIKIARSTIYDWASQEEKKEFSDILEQILSEQERELLNKGLSGAFNANIVKLMLGKHGYHDKQETDITSKGEKISSSEDIKDLSSKFDAFLDGQH